MRSFSILTTLSASCLALLVGACSGSGGSESSTAADTSASEVVTATMLEGTSNTADTAADEVSVSESSQFDSTDRVGDEEGADDSEPSTSPSPSS